MAGDSYFSSQVDRSAFTNVTCAAWQCILTWHRSDTVLSLNTLKKFMKTNEIDTKQKPKRQNMTSTIHGRNPTK